ncbi:MAG: decarboxylating 6-phosphogluconate dehydrogenase [Pseudomonadota bacterium]|nr:decarboxylating 6-phosphogluconate dehydrogenase [Pseudomonadota bacterium]
MQIGMVGLGRMGGNMARRLLRGGCRVSAYDENAAAREPLSVDGAFVAESVPALVASLDAPRIVWLMVPAGAPTDAALVVLAEHLAAGDMIIDGGNANYRDSQRRARELAARDIAFVDCGVSGGVWGLEHGYAVMFGATPAAAAAVTPLMRLLAPTPEAGWLHCGPSGAGHFVKMIHNGIEYGMMQAIAEGLTLMRNKDELALDLAAITQMWRHGSVVRSWLLDLTADFLRTDVQLEQIAPVVADSGEGRWTALEAIEQGVPAPVMSLALMMRFASQGRGDYSDKVLAMMRQQFGGHAVQKGSS